MASATPPAPARLLQASLDRLLAESSRGSELRDAVEASLQKLEQEKEADGGSEANISADNYWRPFKIACQHNQPARTREAALDCLQKLIAHQVLRGALLPEKLEPQPLPPQRRASNTPGVDNDLSHLDISSPPTSPEPVDYNNQEDAAEPAASDSSPVTPQPVHSNGPLITARSTSLLPNAPGETPTYPPNPYLIDEIIHSVCTSFSGGQDEAVQLQVLKVLLTAVTSPACQVHQVSLLKVIQTCFNVHLNSRTQVNQMTAKASLTQMVNLIFSRMERYAEVLARSLETGSMAEIEKLTGLETRTPLDGKPPGDGDSPAVVENDPEEASRSVQSDVSDSVQSDTSVAKEAALETTDEEAAPPPTDAMKDQIATEAPDAPVDIPLTPPTLGEPENVSESELPLATKEASSTAAIKQCAVDDNRASSQDGEVAPAADPATRSTDKIPKCTPVEGNPYNPTITYYNELLRKDVYLVFRLLCRLSVTSENSQSSSVTFNAAHVKEAAAMDEISYQSTKARQLALELIMSVMNNCGAIFQSDDLYVSLIRQNLCLSISRNGVTTNPALFELSLSIFLMVTRYYRSKLKTEVEVLLNTIYLHILEMGNSSYNQKRMVLQGLLKICENPQTLADLYINNDCDIAMVSLFERIVNVCSRVAQGRDTTAPVASTGLMGFAVSAAGLDTKEQLKKGQERRLRLRGLCCLVALVNSLAEWSKDLTPNLPLSLKGRKALWAAKATSAEFARDEKRKSADLGRPSSVDNTNKSFSDALAATNQANPVLVYKHPLHLVSLDHQMSHSFSSGSISSLHGGVSETPPAEDSAQIENMASRKQMLRRDIKLFNQKPVKGVKALIQHNFVEEDVLSIAQFLHNTDSLTKAAIGEYLGEGDPFSIEVMHAFIDTLDFTATDFVPALRGFLQTFRLPGESQKIDRIMEKFADRYYENNPEVFAKADTAYTLAFSVIMLNTDQHSPTIKHRMDKAAFIKNNRGINDDGDLPDELLGNIFDQVSQDEIIMEEEHAGRLAQMAIGWGAGDLNERQRIELYRKEISQVQKKSLGVLRQGQPRSVVPFRTAVGGELARPMFGMASWPLMAVFSLAFEASTDDEEAGIPVGDETSGGPTYEPRPVDLCLEGFALSIRLASIFRMETERDAFVTSLSKLTGLSHIHDIRPKNILAIKTLIMMADQLGEYLEGSWMQVLKAISQLERLQVIANRGNSFDGKRSGEMQREEDGEETGPVSFAPGPRTNASNPPGTSYRTIEDLTSQSRPNPAVEKLIAEFHNQATVVAVDRIFTNTLKLSATAIIHFFKCLCHVSMEEVGIDPLTTPPGAIPNAKSMQATGSAPRMYLLQKIVEIAYYNMPRIRFEWTQIWRILQPYFNTVACHPNVTVSTFGVDSLRQLSMKFLEREELGHWTAQNEFLRSFEWIMKHNQDPRIKELILSSTRQMIMARGKSLRSGWKSIFVVLAKAAQSGDEKIVNLTVNVVQMIFSGFFEYVVGNAGAGFVDFVGCLIEVTLVEGPNSEEVANAGIQLLQGVAKWLLGWTGEVTINGKRKPSVSEVPPTPTTGGMPFGPQRLPSQPYLSPNGLVSEDHFFLKWFPILSAFSRIIIDSESITVRTRAMDALFETLRTAGAVFEVAYWKNIQRSVILPIFAELGRGTGADENDSDNDDTTLDENNPRSALQRVPSSQRGAGAGGVKDPNMTAIYIHGLRLYIDLATTYFTTLSSNPDLLRGVFDLLVGMLTKRDEKLATTGGICLHGFVRDNMGNIESDTVWNVVTEAVERAFKGTVPGELLCCEYDPVPAASIANSTVVPVQDRTPVVDIGYRAAREAVGEGKRVTLDTLDFDYVLVKCVTHLELVQGVRDLVFGGVGANARRASRRDSLLGAVPPSYPNAHQQQPPTTPAISTPSLTAAQGATATTMTSTTPSPTTATPSRPLQAIALIPYTFRRRWIQCLYSSYAVARTFNEESALRYAIYKRGLVPQLPHLVKQETVSFATYLRVLFAAYRLGETSESEDEQNNRYRPSAAAAVNGTAKTIAEEDEVEDSNEKKKQPQQQGGVGPLPGTGDIGTELVTQTLDVLTRYVDFVSDQTRNALHVGLWSPVVVLVFRELLSVDELWRRRTPPSPPPPPQASSPSSPPTPSTTLPNVANGTGGNGPPANSLQRHIKQYFRVAVRMMAVERPEVRAVVQEFLERIGEDYIDV
ncbi:transaldolase [Powellomyces hirtus]|uniref:Transaldolase n=1 Tax=Powellomyces hirtus TaxID=109895 RepID=A0A507E185_9FUNG|nr:transaldolase [Powellomyces hirtus]